MGANLCFASFPASSEAQLRDQFRSHQETCRFEKGHGSYGGHMGMAQGLVILNKTFTDRSEADDYLSTHTEKWGPAVAVKIGSFAKIYPATASELKVEKSYTELKRMHDGWDDYLLKQAKSAKSKFRGCQKCGSKIALKFLTTISCPVCMSNTFLHTETETKKHATLQKRLTGLSLKRKTAMDKYQALNKGKNFWLVGACVSS